MKKKNKEKDNLISIKKFSFKILLIGLFLLPSVSVHSADIDTLRARIKADFLEKNSASGASGHVSSQLPNGSWSDIDYVTGTRAGNPAGEHLQRMKRIAVAYHTPGNSLYQSSSAVDHVENGMDFWVNSTHNLTAYAGNWYSHGISNPQQLAASILLMESQITNSTLLNDAADYVMNGWDGTNYTIGDQSDHVPSGMNYLWIVTNRIYAECSETKNNTSGVDHAFTAIENEMKIVDDVVYFKDNEKFNAEEVRALGGMRPDGSFHQHGPQLYNGAYGRSYVIYIGNLLDFSNRLSYTFSNAKIQVVVDHLLDGTQWMIRRNVIDWGPTGRSVTRYEAKPDVSDFVDLLESYINSTSYRNSELMDFKNHISGTNDNNLSGSKHFYRSDYHSHKRSGYHVSIRGHSQRTSYIESVNNENIQGINLSHGGTVISKDGSEYYGIYPVWDWGHIPGTTSKSTDPAGQPTGGAWSAHTTFVGGVSDGTYGVMALDLDWKGVTGKKSWFMFDDEIVCLGAGITGNEADGIHTTIDQNLKNGNIYAEIGTGDGSLVDTGTTSVPNAKWVWHDDTGYIFPDGRTVKVGNNTQSGSWNEINSTKSTDIISKDVFQAHIDHGLSPSNASYDYIIVPNKSKSETQDLYVNNKIEYLANTSSIQAVRHTDLQLTGMVFYSSGSQVIDSGLTITVDKPCVLLVDRSGSDIKITASDPTQQQTSIQVTLDYNVGADDVLNFSLPTGGSRGNSVSLSATILDSEELIKNGIKIYPNPSNGSFTLDKGDLNVLSLVIYSINGKEIAKHSTEEQTQLYDFNLSPGIYILKAQFENKTKSFKLVIKN